MTHSVFKYGFTCMLAILIFVQARYNIMFVAHWKYPRHQSFQRFIYEPVNPTTHAVITPTLSDKWRNWTSKAGLLTNRTCDMRLKLLVLVTSEPGNFERRKSIRETWGNEWHGRTDLPSWKTYFLCGQAKDESTRSQLLEEDKKYQDIVLGKFTDIFYHLPEKIIMSFEWANRYCDGYEYLMKSDDDVFFSPPNFFKYLSTNRLGKTGIYAGNKVHGMHAFRKGKYAVTKKEYPSRKPYPDFVSGGGMFFTADVAQRMIEAHNPHNYFKLDDVYIAMLAEKLKINVTHIDNLILHLKPTTCQCSPTEITHHKVTTKCMKILYECGKTH